MRQPENKLAVAESNTFVLADSCSCFMYNVYFCALVAALFLVALRLCAITAETNASFWNGSVLRIFVLLLLTLIVVLLMRFVLY